MSIGVMPEVKGMGSRVGVVIDSVGLFAKFLLENVWGCASVKVLLGPIEMCFVGRCAFGSDMCLPCEFGLLGPLVEGSVGLSVMCECSVEAI